MTKLDGMYKYIGKKKIEFDILKLVEITKKRFYILEYGYNKDYVVFTKQQFNKNFILTKYNNVD